MTHPADLPLTYKPVPMAPAPRGVSISTAKSIDDAAEAIKRQVSGAVLSVEKAHKGTPYIVLKPALVVEALRVLRDSPDFHCQNLSVVSATDYPAVAAVAATETDAAVEAQEARMEVVYVIDSYEHNHQFMLKVKLDRDNPRVSTIVDLYRAANWYERECFDLLGVDFEGHPHMKRILLPADWVGHPLRKDYVFPEEYNGMKVPL